MAFWLFAAVGLVFLCTLLVGLLGNCWVVASVLRTSKKAAASSWSGASSIRPPSDRLRKYIWLLALLDLMVSGSLLFRVWTLLLPEQPLSDFQCQLSFGLEQLFKLCSLTCLACISIERFITIRKPFNNKLRKMAVQLTPLFACLSMALCTSAVLWLTSNSVKATEDGQNCGQSKESSVGNQLASWTLAFGFCAQLAVIGFNYVRIVHHVRRKFWQRKARAVANSFSTVAAKPLGQSQSSGSDSHCNNNSNHCSSGNARLLAKKMSPPLLVVVAEPRYMRDMTKAIVRIAVFHLICWLPFCLIQMGPALQAVLPDSLQLSTLKVQSANALRIGNGNNGGILAWLGFAANWLTYANSAGNWVLYAALNRDLRSIIKACSERRRKRSTLSQQQQQHSPINGNNSNHHHHHHLLMKRSTRRNAFQTLRLFYSLNSHRSSASVDLENSGATILAGPGAINHCCGGIGGLEGGGNNANLRAPCGECSGAAARKLSAQSAGSAERPRQQRMPPSSSAELGNDFDGWRESRAHTFCTPPRSLKRQTGSNGNKDGNGTANNGTANNGTGTGTANNNPWAAAIQSAHMRIAQQLMAAASVHNEAKNQRKESAAEKREMFAQKHTPLPPIQIISVGTSSSSSNSISDNCEE